MITHAFVRTSLALASVAVATTALFAAPATSQVAEAAPVAATASSKQKTIIHATFNSTKRGTVDAKSFNSLVGPTNTNSSAFAGMVYRKDYRGSGNVVRTTLTAGKTIHNSGAGRGNVLMVKLPGSYDSACMSYDVRFAGPNVDFSAGGKLPGLVGVAPGTSPSTPEGGGSTAHGWSGRLMWLGAKMWGMVRSAHATNLVVTYLYHPDQDRDYGDNVSWGSSLKPNVWHHVKQCHVMNTVGKSNGVLRTWFDKKLVVDQHDVVYRTDPKVHITHFDWSVFRGGADSVWAGRTTSYVDIDNLLITGA